MNLVDSSAWLEYFANTANAKNFAKAIENEKELLVPTIVIYEVFKKLLLEKGEDTALRLVAHMHLGQIVEINSEIALSAGKLSSTFKIAMADSIILAISQKYNATIWTQDADFSGFENVKYFEKHNM